MRTNPPILELDLPLAPPLNHLHAVVRGRKILSVEGREYKRKVAAILGNGFTYQLLPPQTNLCFEVTFYIPKSSFYKRDLDGGLKATIDAIFNGFKEMGGKANDNRITQLIARKKRASEDDTEGYCSVEISIASEGIER